MLGSLATLIRWGGWSSYHHMYHSIAKSKSEYCINIRWLWSPYVI